MTNDMKRRLIVYAHFNFMRNGAAWKSASTC
jgi:hypothetical protein